MLNLNKEVEYFPCDNESHIKCSIGLPLSQERLKRKVVNYDEVCLCECVCMCKSVACLSNILQIRNISQASLAKA